MNQVIDAMTSRGSADAAPMPAKLSRGSPIGPAKSADEICGLTKPADKRLFAEWGMQLADADLSREIDRERVDKTLLRLRLSSGDAKATEAAALDLLQEFRRQLMNTAA